MFKMKFRPARVVLVSLVMVLTVRVPLTAAMPGADGKWRYLQSPHFEVYSRNIDSESRELLHNLELVHAIFFETFGFKPIRSVPVTVYFFSREKHFDAYKPDSARKLEEIATFYHADRDRGILTVAPLPTYEAAQKFAFGGYAHHLFRLVGDAPPVWYGYGVSGIFRNLVITSGSIELGRPDPGQVGRLQKADLIPIEVMFGADHQAGAFLTDEGNGLFHDESWAMVHYLYFGQNKLPAPGILEFANYALKNSRNFDAAATQRMFEEKLGLTYAQMNQRLARYFRGGRYGYSTLKLPSIPAAKTYLIRPVPQAEIENRLAELALRVNRSPAGKLAMLQATEQPVEAMRAQEVLASDAIKDGEWDVAGDRWERAVAAGSTNAVVLDELCQYKSRKYFQRFDLYFRLPDEAAEDLRRLLHQSILASPQQTAAYEAMAWVEATAREPQIRNINLVQQNFPRLKEKERTLLALAVVRMRLGDNKGAVEILDELGKAPQSDWVAYGMENTRARLEDRPVNRANLPAASKKPSLSPPPIRKVVKPAKN